MGAGFRFRVFSFENEHYVVIFAAKKYRKNNYRYDLRVR